MSDTLLLDAAAEPSKPAVATALGCLVVLARLSDVTLTVEELLKGTSIDPDRITTRQLVGCARKAGFKSKVLSFPGRDVRALERLCPLIVRFTDGSCMVAVGVEDRQGIARVLLEDPNADPESRLLVDSVRFAEVWTGDAIQMKRIFRLNDESMSFGWGLVFAAIMGEKRLVANLMLAAFALSLLALVPALFIKTLSYKVIEYRSVTTLGTISLIFLLLVACETGFGYFRRFYVARVIARADVKISGHVFGKMLNLPIDYFERVPMGLTIYRFTELNRIRIFMTQHVFGTLLDLGVLIFFIPAMMYIDWVLTSIVMVMFAVLVSWIVVMMPYYRMRSGAVITAETVRGTFLVQTVAGIRTVKSLALDARQRHKWQQFTSILSGARMAEGNMENVIQAGSTLLERLMASGVLAIAVYLTLVERNYMQLGTLYVFYLLVSRAVAPLQQAAKLINNYDEARSAVHLVGQLVNQPVEEGRTGTGLRVPLKGHVQFSDVRFKYKGAVRPALRSVSFDVPRGTTLGVMGRSGSGKTTLTRLLQKLHSDYQGLISIDGIDLRDYDLDFLRGSLGVVLQDNFLFSGTIRENITAAKPDASFEEMVRAARLAGAEEFIDKLSRGYETVIYEGSANLSGGQRQRIAIARALITDPKVLILDEATSALDAESESIVNANLRDMADGRTMIVISHRLSSLVHADNILVMDQGQVHDIGPHRVLLERCDIYSGMWHRQNAHAENDPSSETLLLRGANVG